MNGGRFTVRWTNKALQQDIGGILEQRMRAGILMKPVTLAMNEIDAQLERDPGSVGESREAGVRVVSIEPLTVYFRVFAGTRSVKVFRAVDFQHKSE